MIKNKGIFGYKVPTTNLYYSKSFVFPKAKRRLSFPHLIKKTNEGDPGRYSETIEKTQARFWKGPGKFSKANKETTTSATIKKSESQPGPGHYLKSESKDENFFSFGKDEKFSFFSNIEAISEEVPSSWDYTPFPFERKKWIFRILNKFFRNLLKRRLQKQNCFEVFH